MRKLVLLSFFLLFFAGCDKNNDPKDPLGLNNDWKYYEGHLNINNKTGHGIYINGVYTANNSGVSYGDSSTGPDTYEKGVEAFMEEYDNAGNITWGYYYSHYYTYGSGSRDYNLTEADNQYNVNDVGQYPVILKKMTATNKTGFQIYISESNNHYDSFLVLDDGQTGVVDIPGLVTDTRSFYFFVYNNNAFGEPLRMTFSKSFLRNNTTFDIPPELLAKGVVNY